MPKKKITVAQKKSAKKSPKKAVKKVAQKSIAKKAVKSTPKNAVKKVIQKTAKKAVKKTARKATKKAARNSSKNTIAETAQKTAKKALNKKASSSNKLPPVAKAASGASKPKSRESKPAPVVFSLDDVEQLMAAKKKETKSPRETPQKATAAQPKKIVVEEQPAEKRTLGAASLADILGFNPAEKKKNTALSSEEVPKKWKKYYRLLIELRAHLRDEIDLHSLETLKHSARDDSGDLSSYGSHQADAGTDSFDRDFALSLVSNEHEALNEIEDAIQRIKKGNYGLCEVTGKAIPAARLTAVPFARFSVAGQAEYEKNLRRKVDRSGNTGIFGDTSDAPKIVANDEDE